MIDDLFVPYIGFQGISCLSSNDGLVMKSSIFFFS